MADGLFDARNALAVGNYDKAMADAINCTTTESRPDAVTAFQLEKETVVLRAQIGLGEYGAVVRQLQSATHPILKALRDFAEFKNVLKEVGPCPGSENLPAAVQNALLKLNNAAAAASGEHTYVAIFACAAMLHVNDLAGTVKLGRAWLRDMPEAKGSATIRSVIELRSLIAEALLRMNRIDLVKTEVSAMEAVDDECVTTIMYRGILALFEAQKNVNRDINYTNALNCFKDIKLRCCSSAMLLNYIALAYMGMGDFPEAERSLLDADHSSDPDTLANMAAVSAQGGRPTEVMERYFALATGTKGSWCKSFEVAQAAFDSAASDFVAGDQLSE